MIEKLSADELESWRAHPVTEAFVREVGNKLMRMENDLFHASINAPVDQVRRLAGRIEALSEVQQLIETKGEEE